MLMSERDTKFIGDRKYCGKSVPVRVSFVRGQLFLVQGAENIVSLWKSSQVSTATAVHNFYLKQIFGVSEKTLELYTADNSGCFNDPHPLSNVEPRNRIDHITHQALNRLLSGPDLSPIFNRFTENLITRLLRLDIGGEWIDVEDLWGFFKSEVTPAAIEAMCGSSLISLNPSIADDLWAYDSAIPDLVKKGLSRWWAPGSYAKRDHILRSIKKWHTFARVHFDKTQIKTGIHTLFPTNLSVQDKSPSQKWMVWTTKLLLLRTLGAIWA